MRKPSPTLTLLLLALVVTLVARIAGPSDLYDQEQPRTVAYTIDMVDNGNWVAPVDGDGIVATKPPMVNWVAAPFVWVFGPSEWALKMPSVLGGLATLWLVVWMTRWMVRRGLATAAGGVGAIDADADRDAASAAGADAVALIAGLCWLVNYMNFKLIYLARPDTLLVAFLAGAWVCATVALTRGDTPSAADGVAEGEDAAKPRSPRVWTWALGFWLCTAAAALTKGPLAGLVLLYAIPAARLIGGRWGTLRRLGWWWGLPLMLGLVAAWFVPMYLNDPQAFNEKVIDEQVMGRVEEGTPLYLLQTSWQVPFYAVTRFAPWSLFAVLALFHVAPRRWFTGPVGPAVLWTAIVAGVFLLTTKRADRLAPMFIGLAPIAAYWLVIVARKHRLAAPTIAAVGLAIAIGLGVYNFTASPAAKSQLGERVHAFADKVREHTGDDRIAFVNVRARVDPLAALLGHARGAETATPEQLHTARWIIIPVRDEDHASLAVVVSDPLPDTGDKTVVLGLYRSGDR
ncbi:MAG: hypothetical protein GC159_19480 [Phycisphaera sp.]|nr:hypothetical protein [Phycisphaera sp.]